ncbi:MAG: HEAT repeat domain-containing protein [Chloroflexota bacterium]
MADSNFDIWRLQAQADIRGLLEAVRDGTPDVRKRAATALRALGATSAIPALQSILVAEKDPELRKILITTLDYLFQQEVDEDEDDVSEHQSRVVHLIAQLSNNNPEHVIRAAQNLAELQEKLAAEALVQVFQNRQLRADVRLAAAEALIKLESAPVEVTLLAVLRNPDWRMRRNAAAVLGQLHADWAVSPLIGALRDTQEIVRRTAYAALKRIGTPQAMRAIEPPPTAAPQPKPLTPTQPLPPAPELPKPVQPSAVTKPLPPKPTDSQPPSLLDLEHPQPDNKTPTDLEPIPQGSSPLLTDEEETQPTIPPILSDDVS